MSWEEPCVEGWLIPLLVCGFGPDWLKTWLLGASFKLLAERAGTCTHPRDSRVVLKGIGKDGFCKSLIARQGQFHLGCSDRPQRSGCSGPSTFVSLQKSGIEKDDVQSV